MRKRTSCFIFIFLLSFYMLCSTADIQQVQAASAKLSASRKTIYQKNSFTLRLKKYSGEKTLKWSTSDKTIARIKKTSETTCKVTGKKAGKATITVKAGKKKYKCTVTVKSLKNHTHKFKYKKKIRPTCTKNGYSLYKCSCGASKKKKIVKALGHSPSQDRWHIVKEPTEQNAGTAKYICKRCGQILKKQKKITFQELYTYVYREGKVVITDFADNYSGDIHIPNTIEGKAVFDISGTFRGCSGLTSIAIPNSITFIGSNTFEGCTGLAAISIPDSVSYIGANAFKNCTGFTEISIPDSVSGIGDSAFEGCTRLTVITMSKNIASIAPCTFKNCTSLSDISISGSAKYIGAYAFENCISLNNAVLADGLKFIYNNAFMGCSSLTAVTIPYSVTELWSGAFMGCSNLASITIPYKTRVSSGAFDGCRKLTLYCFKDSSAECLAIEENINYVSQIAQVEDYLQYYKNGNGEVIISGYYGSPKELDIPDTLDGGSVTAIGNGAFTNCESLTRVTIPDSVTYIDNYAFSSCSSLTSITIPSSVTSIKPDALINCPHLTVYGESDSAAASYAQKYLIPFAEIP